MLDTNTVSARSLQKSYKSIIETVKIRKQPVVLTTNNQPQAALVSLEDLEKLKLAKTNQSAMDLLKLAMDSREELKSLPGNLREQSNKILYSK